MFCVSPTETIIYNFCSHSQVTMSVLGQIPSVTAYVLFQEKAQEYFQEKAQATILTFLERTCAPSHNIYCRSCLSSCSINTIILTAQEFTHFQELFMVTSRDSCYSSHRSEHSQCYVLYDPNRKQNKTNKQKNQKKIILLLYPVQICLFFSYVLMHTSFLFCTITLVSSYQV